MNVAELADALRGGRPHRATGEHAAHAAEILEAAAASMHEGRPVAVEPSFAAPEHMVWAR